MTRANRGLLILALLLAGGACSSNRSAGDRSVSTRANLITFEEIQQRGPFSNLYDMVRNLRPRWVQAQGPDTFMGAQGEVQVHMDGNRLGSVDALKRMSPSGVTRVEWVAPIDAAARFGLDHSHGAILISTSPAP
jgi:hypothetical protein